MKNKYRYPRITRCRYYNREWVHRDAPRYYLHQEDDRRWLVIDRDTDFAVTPAYRTKGFAVAHFLRTRM